VTAPEGDPDYVFGLAILKSAIALSEANASPRLIGTLRREKFAWGRASGEA